MEWSRQLREQQSQKTEQIRKETDRIKAVADAEREKAVLLVRERRRGLITNQINLCLSVNNLFNFISDHSGEEGTGQGGREEHLHTPERDQPQKESNN